MDQENAYSQYEDWQVELLKNSTVQCEELEFRIDQNFHYVFDKPGEYERLNCVRALIYAHFPDTPSISFGGLPPMFSRYWWQIEAGKKAEEIESLQNPGKPLSQGMWDRYRRMQLYQPRILKIQLLDIGYYKQSLTDSIQALKTPEERIKEIKLRSWALDRFAESIQNDGWPKLLLVVHDRIAERTGSQSFTASRNYFCRVMRRTGEYQIGFFTYCPGGNAVIQDELSRAWSMTVEMGKDIPTWPAITTPEDLLYRFESSARHNSFCLELVQKTLQELASEVMAKESPSPPATPVFSLGHQTASTDEVLATIRSRPVPNGDESMPVRDWFKAIAEGIVQATGPFGAPLKAYLSHLQSGEQREINQKLEQIISGQKAQSKKILSELSELNKVSPVGRFLIRQAGSIAVSLRKEAENTDIDPHSYLASIVPGEWPFYGPTSFTEREVLAELENLYSENMDLFQTDLSLTSFPGKRLQQTGPPRVVLGAFVRLWRGQKMATLANAFSVFAEEHPGSLILQDLTSQLKESAEIESQAS